VEDIGVHEHRGEQREEDRERAGVVLDRETFGFDVRRVKISILIATGGLFPFDRVILRALDIAKRRDLLGHHAEAVGERLANEDLRDIDHHVDDDERRRHPGKSAVIMTFVTENQHGGSPP